MRLRTVCILLLSGLGLLPAVVAHSQQAEIPATGGATGAGAPAAGAAAASTRPCERAELTEQSNRLTAFVKIANETPADFPDMRNAAREAAKEAATYVAYCFRKLKEANDKQLFEACVKKEEELCVDEARAIKVYIRWAKYGAFHLQRQDATCNAKAALVDACKEVAKEDASDPLSAKICTLSMPTAEKLCGGNDPSGQNDPRAANYQRNMLSIGYCCDATCSRPESVSVFHGETSKIACKPREYLKRQCNKSAYEAACRT